MSQSGGLQSCPVILSEIRGFPQSVETSIAVANPDLEVRSSAKVHIAALCRSGRLDLRVRIRHWSLLHFRCVFSSSLNISLQFVIYLLPPFGARCFELFIPSKPSGHYMYRQFNIQQFYVLPTQCIYVFCVDLRTNSDYFPIQH